jgi:hypothetical protein
MDSALPRKSIHLFDLDDTLITTSARIWVVDPNGKPLKSLFTTEFTGYRLKSGEGFDFREFSDLGILSRGIVVKYTKSIIDTILRHGTRSHFGILTARPEKKLHALFLIRFFRTLFGIQLAKEHIFAVADERFAEYKDKHILVSGSAPGSVSGQLPRPFLSLSVPERKALVIAQDLVGRGFNDISFYDDSRENLNSFKVMVQAFPHVVYKPHFIDPTWNKRLSEFWDSQAERKALIRGASSARILLEHHFSASQNLESDLFALQQGKPVQLKTLPAWLVFETGKYSLRRDLNS